jgi:hypothetical protein
VVTAAVVADADCVVCLHDDGPVCPRCRHRLAEQLADLPAMAGRLSVALVPGPGGGGDRVSTGKGEAPMPARLAALTLIAGGSDDARCLFVPAVRIWTTVEPEGGKTWHREQVRDGDGRRVMTLADDQTGVLPLREWLRAWALEWHRALGHSVAEAGPVRAQRRNPPIVQGDRADPVADAWDARWPEPGWGLATRRHHDYLTTWLEQACDRVAHPEDFAASLRTLTGAVRAALGESDDLEYLGRCPEEVFDRATRSATICGATLWHDPYASVITCPRCHTETGQDRRIWLARRILDTWPIDRRRRYPRGLIAILRLPQCPTCSAPLHVDWLDATERADREPFWRPGALTCPDGHPDAAAGRTVG